MNKITQMATIGELRKVLKRLHCPLDIMLVCARWYAAYPLSLRHIEEIMQERGVFVDHATSTPLGIEDSTNLGPCLSQTQAPGGYKLAYGRDPY